MTMIKEKNIGQFNRDVAETGGYLYSDPERLSCRFATMRLVEAIGEITNLVSKRVIDVGCGDGKNSLEYLRYNPSYLLGVDAAESAITAAKKRAKGAKNIEFRAVDIYNLDKIGARFDVAIVNGVLHHLYDLEKAIASLSIIADEVIIIEPNGYNPVLKIIEKISPYHVEHEERSYTLRRMRDYFLNKRGQTVGFFYCGLVPFFCPDSMAKILKAMEPAVEKTPLIKQLSCAVYVLKVRFSK